MIQRRHKLLVAAIAVALGATSLFLQHGVTNAVASENPRSRSAPVVEDKNGHQLGPLVDAVHGITFYSPDLKLLVSADATGSVTTSVSVYYTTPDCSGTPYFMSSNGLETPDASQYVSLLKSANGQYYKLAGAAVVSLRAYSTQDLGSCDYTTTSGFAAPLTLVKGLPFSDPMAAPFQLDG